MNVADVYSLISYITNKNQSGYISPDEFNLIINQAQVEYLDFLLGSLQKYVPGRPVAPVELGQNQPIRQRLSPLIAAPVTLTVSVAGVASYPADYVQADAMYTTAMKRVRFVQQDSLYSYLESVIDTVAEFPIYLIRAGQFQFYPVTLGSALLSYVKKPPAILWDYKLDQNGRPDYEETTSVSPVWADIDIMQIISRALRMTGVSLQANEVSQFANEIKTVGQ